MIKGAALFLLILASIFVYGEEGADPDIYGQSYITTEEEISLEKVEAEIGDLKKIVSSLELENKNLNARLLELEAEQVRLRSMLNDYAALAQRERRRAPVGVIIFLTVLALLGLGAILLVLTKKPLQKNIADPIKPEKERPPESSGREITRSSATNAPYVLPNDAAGESKKDGGATGESQKTSAEKPESHGLRKSGDPITALYHSSAERDRRRKEKVDDIFLEIPKDVYARMYNNEKVDPILEKRGNYISAMFALVNNKSLYPNFHNYNEEYKVPEDQLDALAMVYTIHGNAPGNIIECSPALASRNPEGFYTIHSKGVIKIGG